MRYQGTIYRPPSEAQSLIIQATLGCSWNACTYCEMYRDKDFRVRDLGEILEDLMEASRAMGDAVKNVFVADGDALAMNLSFWEAILKTCRNGFPRLNRVSTYATAINLLQKTPQELQQLREWGLRLLYIGPETGDNVTFKRIAKGADYDDHVQAARKAREAKLDLSAIFLLGIGGVERTNEHAKESARLITAMDPKFLSLLTLTLIPESPISKLEAQNKFTLPTVEGLLREMETIIREARPTQSIFRTNHASNYLPLQGRLPRDRDRFLSVLQFALQGKIPLRPEELRGL